MDSLIDIFQSLDFDSIFHGGDFDLENLYSHLMEYGIDLSQFSPQEISDALDYALSDESTAQTVESLSHGGVGHEVSFGGVEEARDISKSELIDKLKDKNISTDFLDSDSNYGGLDMNSTEKISDRLNDARDDGKISDSEYKSLLQGLKDSSYWR